MPREALEESPETCYSRWRKREDFFDVLVDTLEGVLSCLDAVSSSAAGAKSLYAQVFFSALRNVDFIICLVIMKNACAPLRNCSTVFRCGNPADILCEVEKIPSIIETLSNTLANITTVHSSWFDQAFQLATRIAPEQVCFSEEVNSFESPEIYYRESLSIPLLTSLIDEMKYSFAESHLKALSALSLLPTCSPQPILTESTDKPFSLFLKELPEPEAAEQEINAWSAVWREKYQDVAPPTSIAETLAHVESKNHPTVTLLLKQVAVLPSVSMEFDLMKTTLNSIREKWGLNMEFCRGQAMLSVGEVGAQMSAVCAALATKYPKAIRTISSALSLNVWLAKSSPVTEIANGALLIQKMLQWFTEDVERQNRLEDMILHVFRTDEGKGNELRDKLVKNWDKSHVVHQVIVESLEAVVLCLNELKGQGSSTSDQQRALQFFTAIRSFDFILVTVVQKNVLKVTEKLSEGLLGKPLDVLMSVNSLPDVKAQLGQLLTDIDTHHKAWFDEAVALASKLHVPMLHSALLEPLSEFYKESVSTKAVGHSISEVDGLFTEKVTDTLKCLEIVPYAMSKVETSILSGLVSSLYKADLPDEVSLYTEMKLWKDKWLDPLAGYLPTTVLDALKTSQIRSFVNIETLLRLQVILPFSRRESHFRQGKRSLQEFTGLPLHLQISINIRYFVQVAAAFSIFYYLKSKNICPKKKVPR
uniref:Uncharacterized protein n=1 Tax=Neogobius melanostomus TaxID=47308 RepID=A0A8C6TSY1_9GOBI